MNIILLSGGSGKRLWPLSSEALSKQFLKLLKNDAGEYESMIQRVMRQIKSVHTEARVFVSCNMAQDEVLKRQLGRIETILEPGRRDTFPAIALAAAYLHYAKQMPDDEAFVVCPIDVFAEKLYFELFTRIEAMVARDEYAIGLMGVLPTFPTEKYGYIRQMNGAVSGVVEKPPVDIARRLIEEGALWNCGVFAMKIGYILEKARNYADFNSFEELYEQYEKLPAISFDYEVVEKEPSIGSITYDGVWKDLGTWNTLTEEMSDTTLGGDVLISSGSSNTHVLNMLNIPVIVQDLQDVVVVVSHDGILVTSKHGSSYLKPLAEQITLRPMYEQRGWGNYRVLDYKRVDGGVSSLVKRVQIDAGASYTCLQAMLHSNAWLVVRGKGILSSGCTDSVLSPGSMVQIAEGTEHTILAATAMELIEVQFGIGELLGEETV